MPTPDGISSEDWDVVHELALELLEHSVHNDEASRDDLRRRMLDYLEWLTNKYGSLPSILATRADYVDDLAEQEELLLRAWDLAEERGDRFNLVEIAHSLAELYLEEVKDRTLGSRWLNVLKQKSLEPESTALATEIERLQQLLESQT